MTEEKAGRVVMRVHFWPDQREKLALFDSLTMIAGPTRARRGCRFFGAYGSSDGASDVVLLEEWDSREALEAHIRSIEFRVVLAAMDASTREPSFRVDTLDSSEGFECVAGVLGGGEL